MKITFHTKYDIDDEIYHVTPDSQKGIIVDINYSVKYGTIEYLVAFSAFERVWIDESELSPDKNF